MRMKQQGENVMLLVKMILDAFREAELPGNVTVYQADNISFEPEFMVEWRFTRRIHSVKYNMLQLDDETQEELEKRCEKFISNCKDILERIKKEQEHG